jgi:hypothetical protein
VRTHAPWLRSLRDERPDHSGGTGAHDISGAERVVVVTVILAAAVFEILVFLFLRLPDRDQLTPPPAFTLCGDPPR